MTRPGGHPYSIQVEGRATYQSSDLVFVPSLLLPFGPPVQRDKPSSLFLLTRVSLTATPDGSPVPQALDTIKAADIRLVQTFKSPPAAVKVVLEAVCVMLDVKPTMVPDPTVAGGWRGWGVGGGAGATDRAGGFTASPGSPSYLQGRIMRLREAQSMNSLPVQSSRINRPLDPPVCPRALFVATALVRPSS